MAKSMLSSIVGMPLSLGSMIPQMLKKGSQSDQLRKMQEGRGAGAVAARKSAEQAASDARAVAASGRVGTGGLALLQGLRAGEQARSRGDMQASEIAAGESERATAALRSDDAVRKAMIGKVGQAAAGGLGALDATMQAATDEQGALDLATAEKQAEQDRLNLIVGDPAAAAPAAPAAPADDSDFLAPREIEIGQGPLLGDPELDRDLGLPVEPARDATRDYENEAPVAEEGLAPTSVGDAFESAKQQLDNKLGGETILDPLDVERDAIEQETGRALGSASAALMVASGLSPDTILDTVSPGLRQRKIALALMLSQGTK